MHDPAASPRLTATLLSVQVGRPRTLGFDNAPDETDRPWTTGFFKAPVTGPVWCGRTNLAGDGQADTRAHGGPDKAVLAYAAAHYDLWRAELSLAGMPPGGFGENLTVDTLDENTVCVGDVFEIGSATLQVSQPRGPCWKINRRWRIPDLLARVRQTGRTGWYHRVLAEGFIEAGQTLVLVQRPHPEWTVARATELAARRDTRTAAERDAQIALAECPALAERWRETLLRRVAEHASSA